MSVTEATMQGVTLFTKARRRGNDAFELALTYEGIEIRRPGEDPRHLSWERVSEWEIEQRRGGVLLTLRGGGAVTPLIIPRWSVDELDVVLREVTSNAPAAAAHNGVEPATVEKTAAVVEEAAVETKVEAKIEPPPVAVAESHPSFEEVVSLHLAPPVAERPKIERPKVVTVTEKGGLVWPGADELREPMSEVPSLTWPGEPAASNAASTEFVLPEVPPEAVSSFVATLPLVKEPHDEPVRAEVQSMAVIEEAEILVEPETVVAPDVQPAPQLRLQTPPPPIVIAPTEGSSDEQSPPVKRVERRQRTPRTRPAWSVRQWVGNRSLLRVATTLVLLVALALAVSLVLAQSAGMISLPFLGSPG
jgi:hypothetical protein